MKKIHNLYILFFIASFIYTQEFQSDIIVNYHGASGHMSQYGTDENRLVTDITIGQPFVGTIESNTGNCASVTSEFACSMDIGFWSFLMLPPNAPEVDASDGSSQYVNDGVSYVNVKYLTDPLSPPITHSAPPGVPDAYVDGNWQIRYDDGNGNLVHDGAIVGSISYVTGHTKFSSNYAYAEFKIHAESLSAHSGGAKYSTSAYNTITKISARSMNPKADSKIEMLLLG